MSTRPRITFDNRGYCNACVWNEKKKNLDWQNREKNLRSLLDKHREKSNSFDCLVPVSGGKDGSYVAYNLKQKYGMNPLTVTVTPALATPLGEANLKSFIQSGFNNISVSVDPYSMQKLNRIGLSKIGFPYYGWLIGIHTVPLQIARNFNIELIFYGEDGEVEYGGTDESSINPIYGVEYQKKIYLENFYDEIIKESGLSDQQLTLFRFPAELKTRSQKIEITHWSYFENWDPYRNYLIAKEKCGLQESNETNSGTFTNFAQNDQALYALHTYLMYLKFGFGRANQDACIEIRRGAMSRDQAVNLVNLYDGIYPKEFEPLYLDYYELKKVEFEKILDNFTNKNLFTRSSSGWTPIFKVQ